jgi:hypothetical protein
MSDRRCDRRHLPPPENIAHIVATPLFRLAAEEDERYAMHICRDVAVKFFASWMPATDRSIDDLCGKRAGQCNESPEG